MVVSRCTLVVVSLSCAILKGEGLTTAKMKRVPVVFLPWCTAEAKALAEQKRDTTTREEKRGHRRWQLAVGKEQGY